MSHNSIYVRGLLTLRFPSSFDTEKGTKLMSKSWKNDMVSCSP
jgi:hypothetical protein